MQRKHLFTLLSALMALTACTPGPLPGASQPVVQQGALVPTPTGAVPADTLMLTLSGTVIGLAGPTVDAPVSAYFLGETTAIATGRTGADGSFRLSFPASAADRLINVVATQGKVTLVATTALDSTETNQLRVLSTRATVSVTPASTLLSLALGRRLSALAGSRPSSRTVREAVASLNAAMASAAAAVKGLSPEQLQNFLSVADGLGLGTIPPAIANSLTAADSAFRAALIQATREITAAITAQVQAGATLPSSFDPAAVDFGTVTLPAIPGTPVPGTTGNPANGTPATGTPATGSTSGSGSGGSGGGTDDGGATVDSEASVTVVVSPGELEAEVATPTITLGDLK